MELPKNITQIGEADAKCKIYVEDYVVSFLKQLNPIARDKTMAAALYGRKKTEDDKTYLFVYGAGKLDFIQKEIRHLSQAQMQEIEKIRRHYFGDYEFLGYRILNGEMVDGFHVCEQDVCRYVSGYAQFYENNEAMLTYMLESRREEAAPESVDSEKYDMVRDRQEKRRAKYSQHKKERLEEEEAEKRLSLAQKRGVQTAAAALLVLACALGLTLKTPLKERLENGWDKLREEFVVRKLPDDETGLHLAREEAEKGSATEILTVDDRLSEAVRTENEGKDAIPVNGKVEVAAGTENAEASLEGEAMGQAGMEEPERIGEMDREGMPGEEAIENESAEENGTPAKENVNSDNLAENGDAGKNAEEKAGEGSEEGRSYIVCKGDTLTGISLRIYGNGNHVEQICQLNHIQNPDAIQVGQKIMLP